MGKHITDKELCNIAMKARESAYAPYSGFRVGAALLCDDGTVFTGCNIENASFGATICAERCAVSKAISEGYKGFTKIAVMGSHGDFTMPCGICRQVLYEFMKEGTLIVANGEEIKEYKISDLIPGCFTL